MRISDYCVSYFRGIKELSHFKKCLKEKPVLTVLKVASLVTVVIPLVIGVTLILSSLFGRVKPGFTSDATHKASLLSSRTLISRGSIEWDAEGVNYKKIYRGDDQKLFINGVEVLYFDANIARQVSLKSFREMSPEDREKLIQKLSLQGNIAAIDQFYDKLALADEDEMGLVSLIDLKLDPKISKITYVFSELSELKTMTTRNVMSLSEGQQKIVMKRLESFKEDPSVVLDPSITDILDLPIVQLFKASAEQINASLEKLPPRLLAGLTDEQFSALDFSKLKGPHLEECIVVWFPSTDDKDKLEAAKERFKKLPEAQVNALLSQFNEYQMSLISPEQMKGLDISNLDWQKLSRLFPSTDDKDKLETAKERFKQLPISQVNAALLQFNAYQMSLISLEQIKELDISKLDWQKLGYLFPSTDDKDKLESAKERFKQLSISQVKAKFSILNRYQVSLISPEQMKGLDISNLSFNKLFPAIDYNEVKKDCDNRFSSSSFCSVNGVVIENKTKGASEEQIQEHIKFCQEQNLASWKIFSIEQRKLILPKLSEANRKFLEGQVV